MYAAEYLCGEFPTREYIYKMFAIVNLDEKYITKISHHNNNILYKDTPYILSPKKKAKLRSLNKIKTQFHLYKKFLVEYESYDGVTPRYKFLNPDKKNKLFASLEICNFLNRRITTVLEVIMCMIQLALRRYSFDMAICGSIITRIFTENIDEFADEYKDSDIDIVIFTDCLNMKFLYRRFLNQFGDIERLRSNRFMVEYDDFKFDLFIVNQDIATIISRFHLSCVMGLLSTNYSLFAFPSFILTYATGKTYINAHIKKLTTKNKEAIYKYLRRGFTFKLSTSHMNDMVEYLNSMNYPESDYTIGLEK
jgi:hypothetical protein